MASVFHQQLLNQLVKDGQFVQAGALLATLPPVPETPLRAKNILLAQKNVTLKSSEVVTIAERVHRNVLHKDVIAVGGVEYVITSVQERTYYGRQVNTQPGGGIVLCKTAKQLVIALYTAPNLPADVIPYVEQIAETATQ